MSRQRILLSPENKFIEIPLNLSFKPVDNSDLVDDFVKNETEKAINKPIDGELQTYVPKTSPINMEFKFYNGTSFDSDWNFAGFDISGGEQSKNIFKKSFFALEFFDSASSNTNTKLFTITFPTVTTTNATYSFSTSKDEGYFIFYYRDKFQVNTSGTTIYMKPSFLNAKDGKIKKFVNISTDTTIAVDNYKDELQYFKCKVYRDYTYTYKDNNDNDITSLTIRELKII